MSSRRSAPRQQRSSDRRRFLPDRRGVAAIEVGLVGPVFIVTMLFLFQLCYYLFVQQMMIYATEAAARQIEIGQVQGGGKVQTAAQFRDAVMCPNMMGVLTCGNVMVSVAAVAATSDFYTNAAYSFPKTVKSDTDPPPYCHGAANQFMTVNAVYMLPSILPSIFGQESTYNGSPVLPVSANVSFINEAFPQVVQGKAC